MDVIEAIFVGISRLGMFVVTVLNGIGDANLGGLIPVILLIAVGWAIGVRRSEARRGKYEAKQAKARSTEYRRKGF